MAILKSISSGSGPLNMTHVMPDGQAYAVVSLTARWSAAPSSSQALSVTLDHRNGAEYDTVLYSVDPSVSAVTSLFWQPDAPLFLWPGDALDVTYTNSDGRTVSAELTLRGVGV